MTVGWQPISTSTMMMPPGEVWMRVSGSVGRVCGGIIEDLRNGGGHRWLQSADNTTTSRQPPLPHFLRCPWSSRPHQPPLMLLTCIVAVASHPVMAQKLKNVFC